MPIGPWPILQKRKQKQKVRTRDCGNEHTANITKGDDGHHIRPLLLHHHAAAAAAHRLHAAHHHRVLLLRHHPAAHPLLLLQVLLRVRGLPATLDDVEGVNEFPERQPPVTTHVRLLENLRRVLCWQPKGLKAKLKLVDLNRARAVRVELREHGPRLDLTLRCGLHHVRDPVAV
jgi:hypothetical protein